MNLSSLIELSLHLAKILLIIVIAFLLLRSNKKVHQTMLNSKINVDRGWFDLISKLISVVIFSLAILLILQIMGFNVTPLLAFGGIGAAAIGIAGKDLISNFSGGWMLHFTKPFSIQDQIELPQKGILGIVEKIGWNSTAVRSKNTQMIWVPNSLFITEIIVNVSQMTHRRIDEAFLVSTDKIESISNLVSSIHKFFSEHPEVDPKELLDVHVTNISAVAVEITWIAHTHKTRYEDYMGVKQTLLLDVYDFVSKKGLHMTYPIGQAHSLVTRTHS